MNKEITICPVCKKEIKPPECYWESVQACSACIRKVVLEKREEELAESEMIKDDLED